MVLSTHAVVGAAIASIFPANPLLGFALGFASHFALDAIPHWHYQVRSVLREEGSKKGVDMAIGNKYFLLDLLKIGMDGVLGVCVALLIFNPTQPMIFSGTLLGAIGGMLPDALQFAYWKWKHEPLVSLQRFHHFIHAKSDWDDLPVVGPLAQVLVALVCVVGVNLI